MGTTPTTLEELLDHAQIVACLNRYSRGVDRHDAELLRSAYHDDAIDDHGNHVGSPDELCDWVMQVHASYARHQHYVTNTTIDLDGSVAHVESYYVAAMQPHEDDEPLVVGGGRYIDRFEKRDGEWRIAARVSINEWQHLVTSNQKAHQQRRGTHQSREDVSYQRPLTIRAR